jgi:SAM-dependent methyltransferase
MSDRVQSLVFDEVAELYARARPSYPAEFVADVIAAAALRPGSRVLEIGAGPGNASVLVAGRGFDLVCLEPGAALAAVARRRLAHDRNAAVETTTFEAWPEQPRSFDLVFAAQSIHWVDPAARLAKPARVLKPGGVLALIANVPTHDASPAHAEIDAAYEAHAPGTTNPRWRASGFAFDDLFAAERGFQPAETRRYRWHQRYSTEQYLDLLQTYSDTRMLPPERYAALLGAIETAIDRHGGELEIEYTTTLTWARVAA